jgi:hypothetical protein
MTFAVVSKFGFWGGGLVFLFCFVLALYLPALRLLVGIKIVYNYHRN